jgi:signal transduction histidine kinase/ActR/RegA family two-component response regulator
MEPDASATAALDLLPEPILLVSLDGVILSANLPCGRELQRSRESLIGTSLAATAVDDEGSIANYLKECARSRQLHLGSLTLRRGDGAGMKFRAGGALFSRLDEDPKSRVVLLRLVPSPEGEFAFVALNEKVRQLNAEIARRRLVEEDLKREQETLQVTRKRSEQVLLDADRRKDEFLATLAHELRNPLAPIRNAMRIISGRAEADADVRNATAVVERQLRVLVRLIDDLMDVSRITRGRLELHRERIDLETAVKAAVETSQPLLEMKHHALRVQAPQGVFVQADPTRLAQVFANLLNNSVKYSPPGSEISLSIASEAGQAVVSVSDNGVGIPAPMLPRIFDMFVQLEQSGQREGLGLGLTLVKHIIELHGGLVEAVSAGPGRGSTFKVVLPLADSPPPAPSHEPSVNAARSYRARILVADDNRDAADTLSAILELDGHEVRTAYDGVEALQIAEQFAPQVALLDIGMPNLNGYQTARRIRQQSWGSSMLLVALTGWGQEQDRRQATAAGFDVHLVKPGDPQIIGALIEQSGPRQP